MTSDSLTQIVLGTLAHDTLRYFLIAGGVYLVINRSLSRPLRHRQIRQDRPGWDQMGREIMISTRTILIFALNGILISVAQINGWLPIYLDLATFGWIYFAGSIAGVIVAHDAWFYWTHWIMHRPRLFRWLHRTHHKSHNPTPFTAYAFDPGEAVINAIFLPLFLIVVPMHPLALLIFVIHMTLRNAIGHCGYEVFPARRTGAPLFGWMTTVTHHDLHHANARYNLGLYFTWWDRWVGTEHPGYAAEFARTTRHAKPMRRPIPGAFLLIATLCLMPGIVDADTFFRETWDHGRVQDPTAE
jgi:sterol desaturase/sphingolipid hydroxylase (fatty acid hydroxylase superfamily)